MYTYWNRARQQTDEAVDDSKSSQSLLQHLQYLINSTHCLVFVDPSHMNSFEACTESGEIASLFFATPLSGIILPLAKMNKTFWAEPVDRLVLPVLPELSSTAWIALWQFVRLKMIEELEEVEQVESLVLFA